jgi:predicted lipoprotein
MSRLFLPALLLALSLSSAMAAEDATERTVITNAVDRYIVPGYRDFHADAHALAEATEAFCKEPGVPAFDALRARFGETGEDVTLDGFSTLVMRKGPTGWQIILSQLTPFRGHPPQRS